MRNHLTEYREEVIEELCALGGYTEADAHKIAEEKHADIVYGHKYRLTPSIVAGSILGINDCCIPSYLA